MKYFICIFLLVIITLNSCSDNTNSFVNENEKIKIAALIDLSGHYSQFGIESKQSMELALLETKKIDVTFYDTKADENIANSILDSLINKNKPDVVVTLASWISNNLSQKLKNNNILQMAIGSAVYNYANLNNCIRFTGDVAKETEFLSNYLKKYNKIAVLYFNNDYGIGWENSLKSILGTKLIKSISYSDTNKDFTNQLLEIKNLNPDALVLISTREAVEIVKQAANINLKVDMYGVRPTLTNQLLKEPNADGLMFSYPDLDKSKPIFNLFKSKYGYRMSSFGAEAYDLIKSLDQLYQSNKKNDVLFTNYKNKTYNGALSKIKFDENGQAECEFTICIIKNGTWEELK